MRVTLGVIALGLIFATFSGHSAAKAQAIAADQPTGDKVDSGTYLFHSCQAGIREIDAPTANEVDLRDGGFCRGYFRGFGDYNAMANSSICLDSATTGTVIRVYVAYMEKNPKFLDDMMVIGVIYALKEAYPCPPPKNQ